MVEPIASQMENLFVRNAVEAAIRIGLLWLLALFCFRILEPFIPMVIWAAIIAIALHPVYRSLCEGLRGRRVSAAILLTLACLAVLIGPTVMLLGTVADGAQLLSQQMQQGGLHIPVPGEQVRQWPVIGPAVYETWLLASENLQLVAQKFAPQLREMGGTLLGTAAGAGLMVLQFFAAILIAGIMLVFSRESGVFSTRLFVRLAGKRGERFAGLAQSTVRGVARGILGVALIQALLAGVGMQVAGIPGAGLWALVALVLCVIQLGPVLVLLPAAIYLFYTADTSTAVLFAVWAALVSMLDNVLKPMLMGRGSEVPTAVIFLGALGGFLYLGIVGLFVGSMVLAFGYTLLTSWMSSVAEAGRAAG